MSYEHIAMEVDGSVATITLNRPEKLNAFTARMQHELIAAFDQTDADDAVRAVIVTGAGRAFCAGADLSSGPGAFDAGGSAGVGGAGGAGGESDAAAVASVPEDGGGEVSLRIWRSLKPVIAAINGPAVGVGITMTLPMDIRLASDSARMGFVFARRGIVPEACSSWFLPRLVGISRAAEWVYTGRVFDAAEALAGGLVRSVHPGESLLDEARLLAKEIAANTAPVSVALCRQMLWRGLVEDHPMEAHNADSRGIYERGRSADVREGVAAFLEKRPAQFPEKVSDGLPDLFPRWREPEYE